METNSRRNFIRGMALSGVGAFALPISETFALESKDDKSNLIKGKVILFQGDSITDGNRGRNTDPNHIMGHGYAFSIASRLGARYPKKKLTFYNRGVSGNKVNDLATRWQKDTLDLKPDVLSILVGVNDSASVVFKREPIISVEEYEKAYRALLDLTKVQYPEIQLVLCEPFILKVGKVRDNWEAYQNDISQRQTIVKKLAEQYNAVFVGLQKVFDKACKKAPADYWIWDGVHPTVAGHELITRKWLKMAKKKVL
ncbi:MAG: SGNH/GDSL hydrolase family protein [Mariniphaga sp.]